MRLLGSLPFLRVGALVLFLGSIPIGGGVAQEPPVLKKIVTEMEAVFSETQGMIDHTMTVQGYAREILAEEAEADSLVTIGSALLHDIGIPKAREVHGSSRGEFQEIEGPPIAKEILTRLGVSEPAVAHICGIVANHHSDQDPTIVGSIEFKILWDADWLVNFPGRHRESSVQEKETAIEEIFKTGKGRLLARQMFLE